MLDCGVQVFSFNFHCKNNFKQMLFKFKENKTFQLKYLQTIKKLLILLKFQNIVQY